MIENKIRRLWGAKRFFNEVLLCIILSIVAFNDAISHFLKIEGLYFFLLKLVFLVSAISYIYVILKKYKEAVNNKIIYQSIADCSQEALIACNAKGKFIYHNPVAEALYSIMKDFPSSFFESLSISRAKGREFQISNSVNGKVICYYTSSIIDPAGAVIGTILSAPNMTGQKSENDQVKRKQRDLEHAQQIAHIGNWEMDLSSREMTCSKEFYRICGMSPETELSEQSIREVIHPDDIEDFYAEVQTAREGRRPFEFVGRIVRPDGEQRHVLAQGIWLLNETDECTHVFGVVQDITERKKTEQELLQTRTMLQETLDRLDIVLWAQDFETKSSLLLTENTEKVFGMSKEQVNNGYDYHQIIHPDDLKMVLEKNNSGEQQLYEFRLINRKINELRWIQTQLRPEKDENGQVTAIYGISIDVTERKRAEEIIEAQNEVLSMIALGKPLSDILWKIAEHTNSELLERYCSILLVDQERQVFADGASPEFPDVYKEAILNKPIDTMKNPIGRAVDLKQPVMVLDILNDPLWERSGFQQTTEAYRLKSCWIYPVLSADNKVLAVYALYSQKEGEPKAYEMEMIEAFVNLTSLAIERKEHEEKIRHLAFYDSLTGLYNRSYFADQFNICINEASLTNQKLALLFIDLDQFKWVNDSLGHDAGDQLLIKVANLMRRCIGEGEILARIGGDEFTILLTNVPSEEDALNIASSLMDSLQAPIALLGHEFRITASIGVSLYPDHGYTVNDMMKHADSAMYQAKAEGRNAVKAYHPSSDHSTYGRFYLQTQLHQALAEDQFVLHYQPRIELKTGTIQSVEALIRWDHPVMGIIPPDVFISLAEQSGFIVPLGEWVLREACRQNKEWRDRGFPALRIAVNVSAQQFHQDSFVSRLNDILSETGLSPESLEVEITESALMNHEKRIIAKLQQLNQMGIHVSIDDFGTGYSSLNYLKSFDVKALKIDRSFIRDLFEDEKDSAITKMIISLAHNLQLEVIGEGVETVHQHEFLLHNGCEHAQGFLYCRPLSADMMAQKLKENLMTLIIGENNP
jgi:diguanylate cyclase (GGDEF)-like protein/PAS domain S-box-containing protein